MSDWELSAGKLLALLAQANRTDRSDNGLAVTDGEDVYDGVSYE